MFPYYTYSNDYSGYSQTVIAKEKKCMSFLLCHAFMQMYSTAVTAVLDFF